MRRGSARSPPIPTTNCWRRRCTVTRRRSRRPSRHRRWSRRPAPRSDRASAVMRALLLCSALAGSGRLPHASARSRPRPWSERRAALQAIDKLPGQRSARGGHAYRRASAPNLRWQQQGAASDLLLRAPLGVGGAHLNFDGEMLRVTNSQGTQLEGAQAQAELVRAAGLRTAVERVCDTGCWVRRIRPALATEIARWRTAPGAIAAGRVADRLQRIPAGRGICGCRVTSNCIAVSVKVKLQLSHWQLP